MRVRMLISPLILSLALGFLVVVVPLHASADCPNWCGCCSCAMKYLTNPPCTCSEDNPDCPQCTCNSDPGLFHAFTAKGVKDTSSIRGGLTFAFAESDIIQRVMEVRMGRHCFRTMVALSLLGNARESQKFVSVRFDENTMLASLLQADKAK